jgi:hypothetical protein
MGDREEIKWVGLKVNQRINKLRLKPAPLKDRWYKHFQDLSTILDLKIKYY